MSRRQAARAGAGRRQAARAAQGRSAQTPRTRKAALAVAAIVFLIACACLLPQRLQKAEPEQADGVHVAGAYTAALRDGAFEADDLLEDLCEIGFVPLEKSMVPDWFVDEIMPLREGVDGVATSNWSIVGLFEDGCISEVLDGFSETFAEKGWRGYESGMDGAATYVKEEGLCSWMMMTCTEVGDMTSVVLRIQHR